MLSSEDEGPPPSSLEQQQALRRAELRAQPLVIGAAQGGAGVGGGAAAKKKVKRLTRGEREEISEAYEWSAWVSTCGVISIAITATYFRLLREVSDTVGGCTSRTHS
jgi:hypothetical protein